MDRGREPHRKAAALGSSNMDVLATVETDLFDRREVKPHFT
jgi:hypothetical protein